MFNPSWAFTLCVVPAIVPSGRGGRRARVRHQVPLGWPLPTWYPTNEHPQRGPADPASPIRGQPKISLLVQTIHPSNPALQKLSPRQKTAGHPNHFSETCLRGDGAKKQVNRGSLLGGEWFFVFLRNMNIMSRGTSLLRVRSELFVFFFF